MLKTFPARLTAAEYSFLNSPVASSGSIVLIHAMMTSRPALAARVLAARGFLGRRIAGRKDLRYGRNRLSRYNTGFNFVCPVPLGGVDEGHSKCHFEPVARGRAIHGMRADFRRAARNLSAGFCSDGLGPVADRSAPA